MDIGVGAKLIGDIVIADDIVIGSGAVVVSSFIERRITVWLYQPKGLNKGTVSFDSIYLLNHTYILISA